MICEFLKVREAQAALASEYDMAFAIIIIGSQATDCSNDLLMKFWLLVGPTFRSVCAGRTKTGLGVGMGRA